MKAIWQRRGGADALGGMATAPRPDGRGVPTKRQL